MNPKNAYTDPPSKDKLLKTFRGIYQKCNQTKFEYSTGQWSPQNLYGEKRYSRDQLIWLRHNSDIPHFIPEMVRKYGIMQNTLMPSFARTPMRMPSQKVQATIQQNYYNNRHQAQPNTKRNRSRSHIPKSNQSNTNINNSNNNKPNKSYSSSKETKGK